MDQNLWSPCGFFVSQTNISLLFLLDFATLLATAPNLLSYIALQPKHVHTDNNMSYD